jgi:hypothetical protein
VRSTADTGADSLRRAISQANRNGGADSIRFRIPGTGVKTIKPASPLPDISDNPVTVNGYSQPGASPNTLAVGNDARLRIQLNGSEAGAAADGLRVIEGFSTTIKGLAINRFGGDGIHMADASDNTVQGNFVGTNPAGTADLGNGGNGVLVFAGNNNTVGGTASAARNLVSGNDAIGVRLRSGSGSDVASLDRIQGNYVGTDRHGSVDLGNAQAGLSVNGVSNTVGGTTSESRNVISGNGGDGVRVTGGFSFASNTVEGNIVGIEADGNGALGNAANGIGIVESGRNTIGGAASANGNRIAHNGGDGVFVDSQSTGNDILSNQTFVNTGLGIDLGDDGVSANDTDDPDSGANRLQNFPVLSSATRSQSTGFTTISGTLNSNPSQNYTIQCFVAVPDTSGHGEGLIPVGQTTAATNANGDDNSFTCPATPVPQPGQTVTATATNTATDDTSEFSQNIGVTPGP